MNSLSTDIIEDAAIPDPSIEPDLDIGGLKATSVDKYRGVALKILESRNLLHKIALATSDVVNETDNILYCFLCILGKQSVEIQGRTAAGKNTLADRVMALFPPDSWRKITSLTDKALRYLPSQMGTLYLAERRGMDNGEESNAEYDIKVSISEGSLEIAIVRFNPKTHQHETIFERKKIDSFIWTNTYYGIPEELENRLHVVKVRDDEAQNKAVRDHQLEEATKFPWERPKFAGVDMVIQQIVELINEASPSEVVIPYAPRLERILSTRSTAVRRNTQKILSLIRASARLHYMQRPIVQDPMKKESSLIALPEDFLYVWKVGSRSIMQLVTGLPDTLREGVECCKKLAGPDLQPLTIPQLQKEMATSYSKAYQVARALEDRNIITRIDDKGSHNMVFFKLNPEKAISSSFEAYTDADFSDFEKGIKSCLDGIGIKWGRQAVGISDPLTGKSISTPWMGLLEEGISKDELPIQILSGHDSRQSGETKAIPSVLDANEDSPSSVPQYYEITNDTWNGLQAYRCKVCSPASLIAQVGSSGLNLLRRHLIELHNIDFSQIKGDGAMRSSI